MSIGLPIEQWLQALTNLASREDDPQVFLEQACAEISQRLPWVTGGEWVAGTSSGCFGATEGRPSLGVQPRRHGAGALHPACTVADTDLALQSAGPVARAVPCRQATHAGVQAVVLHAGDPRDRGAADPRRQEPVAVAERRMLGRCRDGRRFVGGLSGLVAAPVAGDQRAAWRKPFQNSMRHTIFQPCVQSRPRTGGGNSGKDWRR
jgi:hypothetical protein